MRMEYEVVFDGAHRGQDADLLCCDRLPVKRTDVPIVRPPVPPSALTQTRAVRAAAHAAVVVHIATQALTVRDLAMVTGYDVDSVRVAITKLKRQGRIDVVPVATAYRAIYQPVVAYRLVRVAEG